ncbi:MAG: prepilin-type N-terminal cleavage/methylation domain-containing protein [Chloroflexi bacterium]|nr:prepilin-type N-terminal cleavage/methylation domain-containing protein [Chloroflexota bacterium]
MGSLDQRGLTLVELLLAAAISALIATTLGAAIHQFIMASERGNDNLRALHDVQNAGFWLTLDGERAEGTNLVDSAPPAQSMTLSWTSGGQAHTSTYSISGTALKRDHNGTITTVARHVASAQFSFAGRVITAAMTSTPAGRWGVSEQATYKIWLRPTD